MTTRRLPPSRRRRLVELIERIEERLTVYRDELEETADEGEEEDAADWLTSARMALSEATWLLDPRNDDHPNHPRNR